MEKKSKLYGRNQVNMLNAGKALAEDEILSGKYKNFSGASEALKAINDYLKVLPDKRYGSEVKNVADVFKAYNRAGPKSFKKKTLLK